MKMRIKAIVKSIGTYEFELPDNFNDNEVKEYIKDNADKLEWKDVETDDVDYEILDDHIIDEDEYINKDWERASIEYDAWKCGDYDE